jgi:hypothetical protein
MRTALPDRKKKYIMSIIGNNKKKWIMLLVTVLFFAVHLWLFNFCGIKLDSFIWSDATGYYQYLPEIILNGNVTQLPYAVPNGNGMTVDKYTCGVALLEAPWFFITLLYCKIFGLSQNGYSGEYGFSIWLSAVTYAYLGLVFLYSFLRKWFTSIVSLISVLAVYLCTNLYYYTVFESGMSHVYSFFLLSLFLFSLNKFIYHPKLSSAFLTGFSFGLAVMIRPTNVFYGLLFLLFDVGSFAAFKARLKWILQNAKYFFIILIAVLIAFLPQMLYWHAVTGKYFVYSYEYSAGGKLETFEFWNAPKIGYVLFGVESGLFNYAYVLYFFLAGLLWMMKTRNKEWIYLLLLFLLITYSNASWWAYTFSCSFGHRAFIEYYPLFIIPVAFMLQKAFIAKRKILLSVMMFFLLVFGFTAVRMALLYHNEACWTRPGWTWVNYNRLLNKVFYIIPQSKNVK